jgi:hypothetical protein
VKRFSTWIAITTVMGIFACGDSDARAGSVVVTISGTFGEFDYGNQPAPLNDGSFSGTVTFATFPAPNSQEISGTADVNFYDSTNHLVFSVGGLGTYNTLDAGGTDYTLLTVSGYGIAGSSLVDVGFLGLEFSSWPFGSNLGTVKPFGPPNYDSGIEYTYYPGGTTYFNPILTGVASVPEPSSIVLSMAGMVGVVVLGRYNRRKTAA